MNVKKITPIILSLIGAGFGYVATNSTLFSLCSTESYECRDFYNKVGDPLFYGMGALAIVFLILLLTPKAVPAWKKFAVWFIPVAAIVFAVYPQPGAWDFLSPDPITVFKWVSAFYVVASLCIIALSFRSSK